MVFGVWYMVRSRIKIIHARHTLFFYRCLSRIDQARFHLSIRLPVCWETTANALLYIQIHLYYHVKIRPISDAVVNFVRFCQAKQFFICKACSYTYTYICSNNNFELGSAFSNFHQFIDKIPLTMNNAATFVISKFSEQSILFHPEV